MCAIRKMIKKRPLWTHIDQEHNRCKTVKSYLTIKYWDACCYCHCLSINARCKCCDVVLYQFLSPTSNSRYCKPLVDAALEGLQKRFKDMMAEPEFIAAAILLPKFNSVDIWWEPIKPRYVSMYVHMFCCIFISDVMRLVHKTKVNKKTKQAHLYKFIYLKEWGVVTWIHIYMPKRQVWCRWIPIALLFKVLHAVHVVQEKEQGNLTQPRLSCGHGSKADLMGHRNWSLPSYVSFSCLSICCSKLVHSFSSVLYTGIALSFI